MRFIRPLLCLILLSLLAACGDSPATATVDPAVALANAKATVAALVTATPTAAPTATPAPTATLAPTATPMPPTATPTAFPTLALPTPVPTDGPPETVVRPLTDVGIKGVDRIYIVEVGNVRIGVTNVAPQDIGGETFDMASVVVFNKGSDRPLSVDKSQFSFITTDNRVVVPVDAVGDMAPLQKVVLQPTQVINGTNVTGAILLALGSKDVVKTAIWRYSGYSITIDLTSTKQG